MTRTPYAGVGARVTPERTLCLMRDAAALLDSKGYLLRSGGADGADMAFALGTENKEIFTAQDATAAARFHAARFYPAWDRLSRYVQNLMARNSMIMLGRNLNDPVRFVLCWTERGQVIGGTGQALRIAAAYEIPVMNFASHSEEFIAEVLRRV